MDQDLPVVPPPPLPQRLSVRQWTVVDIVLTALLAAGGIAGVAGGFEQTGRHDSAWNVLRYVLILAACIALPYRRLYPRPVLAIIAPTLMAMVVIGSRGPMMLAVVLAIYTVAAQSEPRASLRIAAMVTTGVTIASLAATGGPSLVGPPLILVGWLAGENTRTRRAYLAGVTAWAAERDRQREERSRQAVADERLRIARELHDVVAHTMSVVAVRSGVARVVLHSQPEEVERALGIIETTSRRALHEMRLLVGVLREGDAGRELTPAPGLADLPELVEEIGAAGVTVAIRVEGPPRALPAGVDVSAFRILQEALTNVVRHARPAAARVDLRYRADEVEIEVTDDGARHARSLPLPSNPRPSNPRPSNPRPASAPAAPRIAVTAVREELAPAAGRGHGLIGMRERVALFGGTFAAGPLATGFRVTAIIPTNERAPAGP